MKPYDRPRFRPCGLPDCKICRWNADDAPADSGHEDTLAEMLLGLAFVVVAVLGVLYILPIIAS